MLRAFGCRQIVEAVVFLALVGALSYYFAAAGGSTLPSADGNLVADPSFEESMPRNQHGLVFKHWGGWVYDGKCEFRTSEVARSGKLSLLLVGGSGAKIRGWPEGLRLTPGRYRITAYLRGLDIGTGEYGATTEFMFAGKYIDLKKNGSFGWSRLTYVGEATSKDPPQPAFGLRAPGYLWVEDVRVERVGPDVALTAAPLLGAEEAAIVPPGKLDATPVRCPECGYRNNASWNRCYGCGTRLESATVSAEGPSVRNIATFDDGNPFNEGGISAQHPANGTKALRLDSGFAAMNAAQNWTGYDYLKADLYTASKEPVKFSIEIRDRGTRDYWTRVNYESVAPPGASTLIVPTALYVGEKSRPGRSLMLDAVTRLVFALGDDPGAPLFIDNIRLERDTTTAAVRFDGLWAFDVGPTGSVVMEGFTGLHPSKTYSRGRGFGWKDARIWRGFDVLQPDPLYRDFLCVEAGGLAIDVPNGAYHVFVNMDSASGYWGEYQHYRRRELLLEGEVMRDTMDLVNLRERYYRHWERDDLPGDNTFDTYQTPYFKEKYFLVHVQDGQLNIDFRGDNWACCVSAIVAFPAAKADEGKRFLQFANQRRRFHFDNTFKRVLPTPTGVEPKASLEDRNRGFIAFQRDWMKDVNVSDRPLPGERIAELAGSAFAGEYEPLTCSLYPLQDLGAVSAAISDMRGPGDAVISAESIDVGHVRHRLGRVTMDGSVYTIKPRHILPRSTAPVPAGVTRTFWLTVKVPPDAAAGEYRGELKLSAEKGGSQTLPVKFVVRRGTLDGLDVPAGPWGHTMDLPWFEDEAADWNSALAVKSLRKLRDYGFTTATGLPVLRYEGFRNGVPNIDFTTGDAQMQRFKDAGFRMPVVSYCPFEGLELYYRDNSAMREAGFSDYSDFIRAVFGSVQQHAREARWLPVYWNIADEPVGDDLDRSAENAAAYRRAFPSGPPYFTGASSFKGSNSSDPHFRLSRALHVANWNVHDAAGVKLLHDSGGEWAFYNGGNRWTFGYYLYKARQQGMKFRVAWHWNASGGDPYYALDCREDDYAWCNTNAAGELIPAVHFERLREGLDDYRRLRTLARLAEENAGTPAAREAQKLIAATLAAFELGDRELRGAASFTELRERFDAAIERLR